MENQKYKKFHILLKPDIPKITQALNWFCLMNDNDLNKIKAVKLMLFADRYHLRKYGRLISCDNYYAMKMGSVGSKTADMTKIIGSSISNNTHNYSSNGAFNKDVFSESDIEALKFSYKYFNHFNYSTLANITHDYPEWKEYKKDFDNSNNKRKKFCLDIIKFFDDPNISDSYYIQTYLNGRNVFKEDKKLLKCNKILFLDSLKLNELWNE